MKQNDVIKALECCAAPVMNCDECPVDKAKKDDCVCGVYVAGEALKVISELTEENERRTIMKNNFNILHNTLEGMMSDAEDNGKNFIQPLLSAEDVKAINYALNLASAPKEQCADTEKKTAPPFMQKEFIETAERMSSPDYKERFKAEYLQVKIRYERLKRFNTRIEAAARARENKDIYGVDLNVAEPKHTCPGYLLRDQQRVMGEYLHILEVRAVLEDIDLDEA